MLLKNLYMLVYVAVKFAYGEEDSDEGEPSIELSLNDDIHVLEKGQQLVVRCQGFNLQRPLRWYNPRNAEVPVDERTVRVHVESTNTNDYFLMIEMAEMEDEGNWTCKSGNIQMPIAVKIVDIAEFVNVATVQNGTEEQDITLRCRAQGVPLPQIRWYRDGERINSIPNRYEVSEDGNLKILNLSREDKGNYVCQAFQEVNEIWLHYNEINVTLTVKHKPVMVHAKLDAVFGLLGETLYLTCMVEAYPPPKYRWYKVRNNYDVPISEFGDVINTADDGSSSVLTVKLRTLDEFMDYKCRATNNQGVTDDIFHVLPGNKALPPTEINVSDVNSSTIVFEIPCYNCSALENLDPENLPITGYQFQILEDKRDPARSWIEPAIDWDESLVVDVERTDNNMTLYEVAGLNATTSYLIRVAAKNYAGLSDYTEGSYYMTSIGAQLYLCFYITMFSLIIAIQNKSVWV